jgi:heparan-alpha-glucosaminide N-acetyltransferase
MRYNQLSNDRILSIDAFRGITILVMIFVNELAGVRDIPAWMKHMPRDADAMSFVDVVFPGFLFIVGMSIPFAINQRLKKGASFVQLQQHILFRTLGLLVLGFFMVNAEGGYDEKAMGISISLWSILFFAAVILVWKVYRTSNKILVYSLRAIGFIILVVLAFIYRGQNGGYITPRWWGILGLIGWAYLYSCIFYQLFSGNKYWLTLMIGVCVAFYAVGKMPSVEHSDWWSWISARKGDAAHTSIALCGMIVTLLFFDQARPVTERMRFFNALCFALFLFAAGYLLRPYFKISKIYATPTWCLYSAASCTIIFSFLYWLIDKKKIQGWTNFFKPAASNPLLTYIIPDIIYYLTALIGIVIVPHFCRSGWPGIVWSAFFAVAVMGIVILLNRMKLKLQL